MYSVKCDDCKTELRRTDSLRESAAGGRCDDCKSAAAGERFTRQLRNLESMYRRLDSGELTGRNANSSDAGREASYRRLRDMVAADAQTDDAPLCRYLDEHPKVEARWNRLERRSVGLPS